MAGPQRRRRPALAPKTSAPGGPSTDLKTRGRRSNQWPLRLCTMKDTSTDNRDDIPGEPQSFSDQTTVSHTPRQRRMYLKGLRAWARVAVRSYVNRHGAQGKPAATSDDSQEDEASSR